MQPLADDPSQSAMRATRAIYAELDQRPVQRDCIRRTECCQFKLTGRTPTLTAGEALVAAAALRATGRRSLPESADEKTGRCPLLNPAGKCLIYDARPFGCRTHFCSAAGGPYTRDEVRDLVRRLEEIDARLGGDGPHVLPMALEDALEKSLRPARGAQRR
ncbi:MAG: YkgJ family cysteine cluster protein [Verrucomicrobia bacterium]|nr:YkgJ family cysteine cluster protein [Verrucomicrobiota bacterium]